MKSRAILPFLLLLPALWSACTEPEPDVDGDGFRQVFDCDDTNPDIYPGAQDICADGVDQDCDGADNTDCLSDDDLLPDWDQDGHMAPKDGGDDCNDTRNDIHPGADEIPYDGVDQDCDGADLTDVDGDGDDATIAGGGDCDDQDPSISSFTGEIPYDGVDQDCDGTDLTDVDGDGAAGFPVGGDCNDDDPNVYPGAEETSGDGVDSNCDGLDNVDGDGDGYPLPEDCNDGDPSIHPDQEDIGCNDVDENCDGWTSDEDCDGEDATPAGGDCDDTNPGISSAAQEIACNDVDENCDGWVSDKDCDGEEAAPFGSDCDDTDAGRSTLHEEVTCNDIDEDCDGAAADEDCDGENSERLGGADCDDQNPSVKPFAIEFINEIDDNCNGEIDEIQDMDDARVALDGEAGARAGTALAIGDFDGDGMSDVAIGAPEWATSSGRQTGAVFIVYGKPEGLADMALSNSATILQGIHQGDRCGATLAATDIDQDGADDLLIGAPGANGVHGRSGAVYVVLGGSQLPDMFVDAAAVVTIMGEDEGDEFGSVLAIAGDVDDDGRKDCLISAPEASTDRGDAAGFAHLFLGANLLHATSYLDADFTREGVEANARAGAYLAGTGDINGDGFDDFAIGAPGTDQGDGRIELYYGGPSRSEWTPSGCRCLTLNGSRGGLGPVSPAGDINNDGANDLLVAGPNLSEGAGEVFLLLGPIAPGGGQCQVISTALASFKGEIPGAHFGTTMFLADLDNDGYPDLLVGAPDQDGGRGAMYLFAGDVGWSWNIHARDAASSWSGNADGQAIGAQGAIDDLNGDGWLDLLAGAPGDNGPGPSAGAVYGFVW